MTKLKVFFDWFFKIGLSILLVLFLAFAPFTIMPSLLQSQANVNRTDEFQSQGIFELWHIETFEGGSASRTSFLEKQAIAFEKENKGVYIVVNSMSLEQFAINVSNDKYPNMISFGIGIGDGIADKLCSIDFDVGIRDELLCGGIFNKKQLAMPYILGGYALISKGDSQSNVVGTGFKGSTNSLKSVVSNGLHINLSNEIDFDTYDAYDKFLKGKYDTLLGTQRDVYRIKNRVDKGTLSGVEYQFLSGYTDLVQYISIVKTEAKDEEICKRFVKQLLSENTQQMLGKINMFSVLNNLKLYTDDIFAQMENALADKLEVENVFLNNNKIQAEKQKYLELII